MLKAELKKVLDLQKLLLLIVLFILFYFMFFKKNVGIINDNGSLEVQHHIAAEFIQRYGAELDAEEYLDSQENMPKRQENEIDRWIQERSQYTSLGIYTFEEFEKVLNQLSEEKAIVLSGDLNEAFPDDLQSEIRKGILEIQYREILLKEYEDAGKEGGHWNSLMPSYPIMYFLNLLPDYFIFMVISVILLVVPYSVKDSASHIKPLLYSTSRGRGLYVVKRQASFLGTLFILAVEAGILVGITILNDFWTFKNCYISGFASGIVSSLSVTFGIYMFLCIGALALMAALLGIIVFLSAEMCSNYISAMAWQLPVIAFTLMFAFKQTSHFFEGFQNITLFILFTIIFLIAAGFAIMQNLKVKSAEI